MSWIYKIGKNSDMLLAIPLVTLAFIFILSILVYRKGQKDREKALIVEKMTGKRKYKRTKSIDSIKDKLKRGEF
jgi:uncharacterized protein YxeA